MTPSGAGDVARFRARFRRWLDDHLPPEWSRTIFPTNWPPGDDDSEGVAVSRKWHERLYEGGWIAPGWPREHGGLGLGLAHRMVLVEELAATRAPAPIGFQGIDILGPSLIRFGTRQQRERFLPPILTAEELWCQGYSEPDSGSDLASMQTRAVRDGERYVVTGRKVWTSYGSRADWCFLLARTGPADSRSRGISFLLVRMASPGIEWRPLRQMTGERHFGELVLDEVAVPVGQRVGEEGQGWEIAMHSLSHERILSGNVAPMYARLEALKDALRIRGSTRTERQRVAGLEARLRAATGVQARALALDQRGDARFPAWASMVKVLSSEVRIALSEAGSQLLGPAAMVAGPTLDGEALGVPASEAAAWAHEIVDARAAPIYAGTNEVQRSIIAEVGLGLPR